jgi:Uma2 family endonuclease
MSTTANANAQPVQPVPYSVLQAKLQAWLVTILTVVVEAYDLGAVIGKGAQVRVNAQVLLPSVAFVPTRDRKHVKPDEIACAPALAIDVLNSRVSADYKATLREHYAAAGVMEYWQVDADRAQVQCYQADAQGRFDLIPPDVRGMHYSSAIAELVFPVDWFRKQPKLLSMLEWWGLIEGEET